MRLICPNCGAQYEVADDVIPQEGRDVQCSNCAHTWFENRGASDIEDDFSEDAAPASARTDDVAQWGAADYAPKPAAKTTPKPAPQRQELDPAIADILREEAAREASARRAEADAMESQPDLGLDSADAAPDQRTVEAQDRMAQRKGEPQQAPATPSRAAIAAASRGDLLPDIEEINSSLRPESERGTDYPDPYAMPETRKRGARTGFFGVLLILGAMTVVYSFAPKISALAPAADGPLTRYVDTVDTGRLWLDAQLRRAVDAMTTEGVESAPAPDSTPSVSSEAPEMAPVDQ